MSSQSVSPETLVATAEAYLKVFDTMDPSTIEHVQTDSYKHQMAPASLGLSTVFTQETFADHLKRLSGALKSFPVRAVKTWPNPHLNQVVVWATSHTIFHDSVKDSDNEEEWNFKGEYIFALTMDESGHKVSEVFEFLDSKATEVLMPLIFRALAKKAELEGTADVSSSQVNWLTA